MLFDGVKPLMKIPLHVICQLNWFDVVKTFVQKMSLSMHMSDITQSQQKYDDIGESSNFVIAVILPCK